MSERDPKPIEDEPAPSGKQDPSTEAEDKSTEEEVCDSTENENPSTEDEPTQVGEESSSTENEIGYLEDEFTPVGEEISSLEDDSSLTIVGTVERRRPTSDKKHSTPEEVSPTDEREDTAPDEESPTDEREDTAPDEELPTDEGEELALEELPSDEDEELTFEEIEDPFANELDTPTEKQCQTIRVRVPYTEPRCTEEDFDFIDDDIPEGDNMFDEKASQTLITADEVSEVPESITYSCVASIEIDNGSSLDECSSIEEETEISLEELLYITAQVMTRNSSSGGWVPEGGGGMSHVTMMKILDPPEKRIATGYKYTYNITAIRISDSRKAMDCTLGDDFEYNKVMPTFHHWQTGGTRYGLTFRTALDARVFDKTLRKAVHHHMLEKNPNAEPVKCAGDNDDDFLAIAALSKAKKPSPKPQRRCETPEVMRPITLHERKIEFMQLTSLPEYLFTDTSGKATPPMTRVLRRRPLRRTRKPLRFFGTVRRTTRLRCKYCHEIYEEEDNRSGQCRYAPSAMRDIVEDLSCLQCAKWVVQSCMVDPQLEHTHPCTCSDGYCGMRWIGLCLASIFIPCFMLYPPMTACYKCGIHYGVCGGRHEPKDDFDDGIFY